MSEGRVSLRDRLHSLLGGRASDQVAARLLREGAALWAADPLRVQDAIDKVEQAWALTRDPKIAIQLATMYDKVNRNDDALVVLREAFRKDPQDALLRHHAAITLLRHGEPADIRDFFESVLKVDAQDPFARFVMTLLDSYDAWVAQLASSIEKKRDGRRPFLISLPVWGKMFADFSVRYFWASLLSPNNLPALARDHAVHIAIFTNDETEKMLRSEPLFRRLEDYATVDFVHYSRDLIDYRASMERGYGNETVHYSQNSLAFYYARNCKFALMSCAHYVALAAARASDALVSGMVADIVMNDGALPGMAKLMTRADAMLVHALQLPGKIVRPIIDREFRDADGVLAIPSDACSRLLVRHLPEANFADTRRFADPPLRIAWRVGEDGLLVHGNHYHPYCLRPKALTHPLRLSIDPIDSRFIDRTSLDMDRIHLVQDDSIVSMAVDDDPILEPSSNSMGELSVHRFSLWLWGYWGRLRGELFRSPIRFGSVAQHEGGQQVEQAAASIVDAIVGEAEKFEQPNRVRKSWKL
jgi:tetratricopeptide (TPR) repeat protein